MLTSWMLCRKGIAAQNVVKQILVLGIVKNKLSSWKGVFGVRRTSLALPLSFPHDPLRWELLGHICRTERFSWGRRVVCQSNAEACSQVSCSPGDWPYDVVKKMAGINQHHVWSTWSRDR